MVGEKTEQDAKFLVRQELSATLFASPVSLAMASIGGSVAAAFVAISTTDAWIDVVASLLALIGSGRLYFAIRNRHAARGQRWRRLELEYEVGALLFASCMGMLALLVLTRTNEPALHLIWVTTTVAYGTAVAVRNAGRPAMAVSQLLLSTAPLVAGLTISSDPRYWFLASLSSFFVVGVADVTLKTYRVLAGAVDAAHMQATLWRDTLDCIPQMVWAAGPDGTIDYQSRQWRNFCGVGGDGKPEELLRELIHPDDRDRVRERWAAALASGTPYEAEYRLRARNGTYRWVMSRAQPQRDAADTIVRWYGAAIDVDGRVEAEAAAQADQQIVRNLLAASPDSLVLTDFDGRILYVNGCTEDVLGLGECDLLGRMWTRVLWPGTRPAAEAALKLAQRSGEAQRSIFHVHLPREAWWVVLINPVSPELGGEGGWLITARDVTIQKRAELEATWAARNDALTGLSNRAVFTERLEGLVKKPEGAFAVVLADLDEFKLVNDTLGHDAGDALLCAFAERLRAAARSEDVVARLGGDEFAVILTKIGSRDEVESFANRLLASVRAQVPFQGKLMDIRTSLGASIYPQHAEASRDLLKNADLALYAAKTAGRGVLRLYEPEMRSVQARQQEMLTVARVAIEQNLIEPHYQAKIDLHSGLVSGLEAFLRWRAPDGSFQNAATIAAAFDDVPLASRIGHRMTTRVLADIARWQADGVPFHHVAINAAAAEFRQGDFAERFLALLSEAGISSERLQLEVTETVFSGRGAERAAQALRSLSTAGVRIALDDFGTGYASMSNLKRFPVDALKIDRSFVTDLQLNPEDGAIVDAIIGLGRSLNMEVIAEGVESRAQRDFLTALGCSTGQGYLYGHPMPASDVPRFLSRRSATVTGDRATFIASE